MNTSGYLRAGVPGVLQPSNPEQKSDLFLFFTGMSGYDT